MQVNIRIKNIHQIRAAFGSAPRLMANKFRKTIRDMAFLVEGKSKIHTPVDTGFLRSSHVTRFSGSGLSSVGEIEPTAHYAGFVHEGTRFMRGRPFLRQAAESSEGQIQRAFTEATQDVLDDIARRT